MKKVVLMALALGLSLPAMASEKVIDMYKSENCGCCSLWGKAMEKDGFEVRTHVMNDQALWQVNAIAPPRVTLAPLVTSILLRWR
ncbi:TPA: hypothetical protein N7L51_004289 [Escherichia coli]|nr:hypothetical protein [Escherichia coli]